MISIVDQRQRSIREHAEIVYDAGLDLVAEGQTEHAIVKFREALQIDPAFLDPMHGLIRALHEAGNDDEAIIAAQALIERDPEDALAHTSLSILYQHQGMISEAESEALKAKLLGWKLELKATGARSVHDAEK